jgi:hypothetical protein
VSEIVAQRPGPGKWKSEKRKHRANEYLVHFSCDVRRKAVCVSFPGKLDLLELSRNLLKGRGVWSLFYQAQEVLVAFGRREQTLQHN